MAVVDIGYIGTGFIYLYDRVNKVFYEENLTLPFACHYNFQPGLDKKWDFGFIKQKWTIEPKENKIQFKYIGKRLDIDFSIQMNIPGIHCLAPVEGNPFNYTFKNTLLPVSLKAGFDKKVYILSGDYGTIDFTLGYPPRETFWNWASFIGKTKEGKEIGFNLVSDFNNGLENAIWFENKIFPISQIVFSYHSPMKEVLIHSMDDVLLLRFHKEGERTENLNLIAIQSKFVQTFGHFEGKVELDGEIYHVTGQGFVEEHKSIW